MAQLFTEAGEDNVVGDCVLLRAGKVVSLGVNTSAVETSVIWGEGDVLRKCESGLYSSEMPSPVVSTFADVCTVVRGINWVESSICTWFLLVVTAPSVEICGTRILGLVGKSCFLAIVCTVVGPVIGAEVLDGGLRVGTRG